jgi:hypothetical protein
MTSKKPLPFDPNNWPIGILPDGTLNVVEKGAPPWEPKIIDEDFLEPQDDPFLEPDAPDPDDAADEAQDRANGAIGDD